jgi:hypothetical protein
MCVESSQNLDIATNHKREYLSVSPRNVNNSLKVVPPGIERFNQVAVFLQYTFIKKKGNHRKITWKLRCFAVVCFELFPRTEVVIA